MPHVTFIEPDGNHRELDVAAGQNLLDIAWDNDIDIEGTCGGAVACSTCHVIVEGPLFDKLPSAEIEEEDMLDLAYGLTPTSRLGCQVVLTDELDGLVVRLPPETHNLFDG